MKKLVSILNRLSATMQGMVGLFYPTTGYVAIGAKHDPSMNRIRCDCTQHNLRMTHFAKTFLLWVPLWVPQVELLE